MSDTFRMDWPHLKAARQKYLTLGREIEALPSGIDRDNLQHTHSKLGIFLDEALGIAWRAAGESVPNTPAALDTEEGRGS